MADDYKPDPASVFKSQEELFNYILQELNKISAAMAGKMSSEITLQASPPAKPREGLVVGADGSNWDPGSGKGLYAYLQGQWYPLVGVAATSPSPGPTPTPTPDTGGGGTTPPQPLPPEAGFATPTFHSVGLVWRPPSDPGAAGAKLEYRQQGDSVWILAQPMWYDRRNGECRGSVFFLDPNTNYEFQFSMPTGSPLGSTTAKTWNETFPEGEVVHLPDGVRTTPLDITSGGTPTAYKVYTYTTQGQCTIDVKNGATNCINVRAPYVIIRGLQLRGARENGIQLYDGVHDVVIEKNDIAGWGRLDSSMTSKAGFSVGAYLDSAIQAKNIANLKRIIIQYNYLHEPRYGSNSWSQGHPTGPGAITFMQDLLEANNQPQGGNHVIRWNTILGNPRDDFKQWFMDAMGGAPNFGKYGFPGPESDIYGNYIAGCMDDGIEAEGGGNNVRIWGNYLDQCSGAGVATTVVHFGPTYIMRNVFDRARQLWGPGSSWDNTDDSKAFKSATHLGGFGDGRRYVFHNTLLQRPPLPGASLSMGYGEGITGLTTAEPMTNTKSRNNIYFIKKNWHSSVRASGGSGNDFDYDLYNGVTDLGDETNGIRNAPTFKAGHGNSAGSTGKYQLNPSTPGHNAGQALANINDGFLGAAPDMGAHEEGTGDLVFGHLGSGKGNMGT